MAATALPRPAERRTTHDRLTALRTPRLRPELAGLLLLAAVLNVWALGQNGMANEYYAAAVRSMTESWSNFFFASFDSAGVMNVDKPPLAFWVEAASAKVFGFSTWSTLLPQALMGVAAVGLTYDAVRRIFGRAAGFAGGLALATTPISVAISRHNNPDALLVLCSVAAIWFLVRALTAAPEERTTKWLVLTGVAVGLGFETKMGAALMVLPGLALAWLWVAPKGRIAATKQLLAGGGAFLATALAWPVAVWLTPASSRPWVSGTSDNSIWSLIMDYNGLGRISGQAGGPGGGGMGGGVGTSAPSIFGGETGPLRLLDSSLGGQAGWLIGLALAGGAALLVATRLRRTDVRTGWLIAVGGAFLASGVAFSQASGIFHPYYVSAMAPWTAALAGGTVGLLLQRDRIARFAAPAVLFVAVWAQLYVLDRVDGPGLAPWLLVLGGLGAAIALALTEVPKVRAAAVAVVMACLLLAPASWAVQTLGHPTNGTFPAGGPESSSRGGPGGGGPRGGGMRMMAPPSGVGAMRGGPGGGGMFGGRSQALTSAVSYVRAQGGGTIAVASQSQAAAQVLAVDTPGVQIAAIGGFSGRESQVTTDWLADAIEAGKVQYVMATDSGGPGGGGMGGDSRVGARDVLAAVQEAGKAVSSVDGLYDVRDAAAALRAAS